MKLMTTLISFLLALTCIALPAAAHDVSAGRKHHLIIFWDNDTFQGTDQQYTNGFKITWLFPDSNDYEDCIFFPSWLKRAARKLPYGDDPEFRHKIGISFGQHIYTPQDITKKQLIINDRPYAGCLYLSLSLHNKSDFQMDSFAFSVGMVGPSSLAEETQKFTHRMNGSTIPEGWDNQIKDEPVFIISWEHKWRAIFLQGDSGIGMDIIPSVIATAGNAAISGALSTEFRFGYHLPCELGTALNKPMNGVSARMDDREASTKYHPCFGVYISLGGAGYAVLRDISLDGNTWKDSHSVDKEPFFSEAG